jgi:TolB protein
MIEIPTKGAFRPTQPCWSPDGKWITFTQQRGKNFNIGVVEATGGNAVIFSDFQGEDPAWAANSRNIIFTRRAGGVNKKRMAILDVPTEQVKMLPAFAGGVGQPAWQ